MNSLDRYILRQCLTPFLLAIVVVTAIVWMTQSLQRADIIIEYRQGFGVFAWLSLLIVPSLLSIVIPFALFAACLYALQRLHSDSEIAVMFGAGVSRLRIGAPLLLIALVAAAATLWVNIDLMPRSYRLLKQEIADIRADIASLVLRSGEFTSLGGFTVYVEESRPGGQLTGLLVNDHRNGEKTETYMAERGLLTETNLGPVLYLLNGNIQRVGEDQAVEIIRFEDIALNVGGYRNGAGDLQLELTERYLSELFNPDLANDWDRENAGALIAEGHNRLASPLYAFVYVLLALYALIGGAYSRRGYALRIALACAAAGAMRVAGFLAQGAAADTGAYWALYAVPGIVMAALCVLLIGRAVRGDLRSAP